MHSRPFVLLRQLTGRAVQLSKQSKALSQGCYVSCCLWTGTDAEDRMFHVTGISGKESLLSKDMGKKIFLGLEDTVDETSFLGVVPPLHLRKRLRVQS